MAVEHEEASHRGGFFRLVRHGGKRLLDALLTGAAGGWLAKQLFRADSM